jgi:hypothetical protein
MISITGLFRDEQSREGLMNTRSFEMFLLVPALLLALSCGGGSGQNGEAGSTAPAVADESLPAGASGPARVSVSGDTIKVSGSEGGRARLDLKEGGYLVKYRYRGYGLKLEQQSAIGAMNIMPGGQYAGIDGWTQFSDLMRSRNAGEQEFLVTAAEPYEVEFQKLPLAAEPDALPATYRDHGLKVVGPFSLKVGNAVIMVECPDFNRAGFVVELLDASNGAEQGLMILGSGNSISESKSFKVPSAGQYLLKVSANSKAEWTVGVSQ